METYHQVNHHILDPGTRPFTDPMQAVFLCIFQASDHKMDHMTFIHELVDFVNIFPRSL